MFSAKGSGKQAVKVGIVDLDTSHPQAFLPLLRERGHDVIGVWDGGSVHPEAYAGEFARKNHIPKVFADLGEMAGKVDCAIVHACDWDTHLKKAGLFLDAGKSVLLDKPLAGNAADLMMLGDWVEQERRIAGGSALLYCAEATEWRAGGDRGELLTIFCGCGVDEFNYGIHGYAMGLAFAGFDVEAVRHLGVSGSQDVIELSHASGVRTLLQIGETEAWLPFHATIVTTRQVRQLTLDLDKLYATLLDTTLPFLEGKTESPPLTAEALLQPERCALAAQISKKSGGRPVPLAETHQTTLCFNGPAFARRYRSMKYPVL